MGGGVEDWEEAQREAGIEQGDVWVSDGGVRERGYRVDGEGRRVDI